MNQDLFEYNIFRIHSYPMIERSILQNKDMNPKRNFKLIHFFKFPGVSFLTEIS